MCCRSLLYSITPPLGPRMQTNAHGCRQFSGNTITRSWCIVRDQVYRYISTLLLMTNVHSYYVRTINPMTSKFIHRKRKPLHRDLRGKWFQSRRYGRELRAVSLVRTRRFAYTEKIYCRRRHWHGVNLYTTLI